MLDGLAGAEFVWLLSRKGVQGAIGRLAGSTRLGMRIWR